MILLRVIPITIAISLASHLSTAEEVKKVSTYVVKSQDILVTLFLPPQTAFGKPVMVELVIENQRRSSITILEAALPPIYAELTDALTQEKCGYTPFGRNTFGTRGKADSFLIREVRPSEKAKYEFDFNTYYKIVPGVYKWKADISFSIVNNEVEESHDVEFDNVKFEVLPK